MAGKDIPRAHCDFCDRELASGEGGISNVALFPGYPSGRRRQSLGCVDCMRERGADIEQIALAKRAGTVWWEGRQQGKDLYVTPEMLKSSPPESEAGATAGRAAADTLSASPLAAPPPGARHAAPSRKGAGAPSFQMRIESIMPAGFGAQGVMVAGAVEAGEPKVGQSACILHGQERLTVHIKDVQSLVGRTAFLLDGISADRLARGDMLVQARAGAVPGPPPRRGMLPQSAPEYPDGELELESPAQPARGGSVSAPVAGVRPSAGAFQMRIESVSEASDSAGSVVVEGPVQSGTVRIGKPVRILHGNETYGAVVKDAALVGGRSKLVLRDVAREAILEGDAVIQEPVHVSTAAKRAQARDAEAWQAEYQRAFNWLGLGILPLSLFFIFLVVALVAGAGMPGLRRAENWAYMAVALGIPSLAAAYGARRMRRAKRALAELGVTPKLRSSLTVSAEAAGLPEGHPRAVGRTVSALPPRPAALSADLANAFSAHAEVLASPVEHAKRVDPGHVPECRGSRGGRRVLCFLKMGREPAQPAAWCSSVLQDTPGFPVDEICAIWVQRLDRYPTAVSLYVGAHAMTFCRTHDLGEPVLEDLVLRESRDRDGNKVIIYRVRLE